MFAYVVKRLLTGFLVVALVSMMVYALFWYGPKSPAKPICDADRQNRGCTTEVLEQYEERLGYNNPITTEYAKWAKGLFVGREIQFGTNTVDCPAPCLGTSFITRQPVWQELKSRFPATLSIALGGATLYLLVGVSIGVAAARRRGSLGDKALVGGSLFMSSIPYYLVALLAFLYLVILYGVFERGYMSIADGGVSGWFSHLLLPWLVLGVYGSTQYTRFSRGAMVESLNEDYIRTARSKGLPQRTVTYKHALRSALVPVVTIFGIDFAFLLTGTIFTEFIFEIQGIGRWGLDATYEKDLPVVQATVLVGSIIIVLANIIVDLLYSVLDPRVRLT